jgi:D-cysteine desulfhydrase
LVLQNDHQPTLFQNFPNLTKRLAFIPLLTGPTPLERLDGVSQEMGREIWVKRDDLTSPVYGGNKPRKLQFLLAQAQKRGRHTVATMGGIGTNHGLATAVFGSQVGLKVRLILFPQPVTESVRRHLRLFHGLGADLALCNDWRRAGARLSMGGQLRLGVYAIPAGGSSPVGAVGYVDAGLELAYQIRHGMMPRPDAVFTATGTGGTAAGLALGLKLAGLDLPVRAVGVVPLEAANTMTTLRLAQKTLNLLRRGDSSIPEVNLTPSDLKVDPSFLGPGYGHPTPESQAALELIAQRESITLDQTYTSKAFAGLLAAAGDKSQGDGPLLFINTYSSADLSSLPITADWHELPAEFHQFFV